MTATPQPAIRRVPATEVLADIASHAALMAAPLVSFRQIEAAGRSPAPAPAFLFGAFGADLSRAIYGQIETPEIGVYALADAAVAPTGIGLRDGVAFFSTALNLPRAHVAAVTSRLAAADLPVRHVPGPLVPLFGPAEESYQQVIVDYLPRLWLLEQAGYTLADLHILVPAALPPHVEDVLAGLALPPAQIVRYAHWQEVIRTDLLLLPTILRRHDRLSPSFGAATRFWTGRVAVAKARGARIYIADGQVGKLAERIAAAQDFQITQAYRLDFTTRAALFGAATRIVGTAGAALYDAVFAGAGTRLCVLRDARREPGFLLGGVAAALGQTVGYVFADADLDEADYRRALEILQLPDGLGDR